MRRNGERSVAELVRKLGTLSGIAYELDRMTQFLARLCGQPTKQPAPPNPGVIEALVHLELIYNRVQTDSKRNTEVGHWINEAFVVRLWAVLEAHRIVGVRPIAKLRDGAREVRVCRLLRHQIAHSHGTLASKVARRLDWQVRSVFKLGSQASLFDGKFILAKNSVLRPMHRACVRYAQATLEADSV
jgi:hypothetical protein